MILKASGVFLSREQNAGVAADIKLEKNPCLPTAAFDLNYIGLSCELAFWVSRAFPYEIIHSISINKILFQWVLVF